MISIIIPTFNSEKYIKNCLDSLINQENKQYEIIIIDGNSIDNTLKIVDDYSDFIDTFVSEPDEGIYDAWNKGLTKSNYDWIMYLGSDDTLYPNTINKYLNYLNQKNTINYISSKAQLIDDKGNEISIIGKKWDKNRSKRFLEIVHTGSILHKSLFEKYGCFNSKYKIAGDYEFLLRCSNDIKAGFIDDVLIKMRYGGASTKSINKAISESYKAKKYTGNISFIVCLFDYLLSYVKIYGGILKRKTIKVFSN